MITLAQPICLPSFVNNQSSLVGTTLSLNDDTDILGHVAQFPVGGTLTAVQLSLGSTGVAENSVPLRIETVGTDGNPTGTLYVANATGTANFATSDDNVTKEWSINGGTGVTVTAADFAGVVFKRNAAGTLTTALRYWESTIVPVGIGGIRDFNITTASAWDKTGGIGSLAFKIDNVWYAPPGCWGGVQNVVTSESFATAAERGGLFSFPMAVRIVGVRFRANLAAASSIKVSLYTDPTGTPVLRASSAAVDTDISATVAANKWHDVLFSTPYTLAPNTNSVAALSPQDATSHTLVYLDGNATYRAAYPGSTWYARADGGSAFAETDTRVPLIGVWIDRIGAIAAPPLSGLLVQ